MIQDHYRVLGISRGASQDVIRRAYLRMVREHHPDVSKKCGSAEKFKAIASAWQVISNQAICTACLPAIMIMIEMRASFAST